MVFMLHFMTMSGKNGSKPYNSISITFFNLILNAQEVLGTDDTKRLRIYITGDENVLSPTSNIILSDEMPNIFFVFEQPIDSEETKKLWKNIHNGQTIDLDEVRANFENGAEINGLWPYYREYIQYEKYDNLHEILIEYGFNSAKHLENITRRQWNLISHEKKLLILSNGFDFTKSSIFYLFSEELLFKFGHKININILNKKKESLLSKHINSCSINFLKEFFNLFLNININFQYNHIKSRTLFHPGDTLLHAVCRSAEINLTKLEFLLQNGAENIANSAGKTPLDILQEINRTKAIYKVTKAIEIIEEHVNS